MIPYHKTYYILQKHELEGSILKLEILYNQRLIDKNLAENQSSKRSSWYDLLAVQEEEG